MTEQQLKKYSCRISALSVFRGVLKDSVISALLAYLKSEGDVCERLSLYGDFVYEVNNRGGCFSDVLRRVVFEDENAYITSVAWKKDVSKSILSNTAAELKLFAELTDLTPDELTSALEYDGYIPMFESAHVDFESEYAKRAENISSTGYGIFASSGMFRVEGDEILPVAAADTISMGSLVGYADERQQVIDNTRALVEGRPAANVLLCGDAGTGKSSTVKAVANMFYDCGVRLIELRKDQLRMLPVVMGRISRNPLKFIIFIDDLSFNKNDDSFSMLKAALEGSASAKAENAVIYATSNRRHIVKETFSDRAGDDIHRMDTMQELLSLSDRFGLVVYFSRPNKKLYLDIVHELANRAGLDIDTKELDLKAEAYALGKGSRSARAAEQFIKNLI